MRQARGVLHASNHVQPTYMMVPWLACPSQMSPNDSNYQAVVSVADAGTTQGQFSDRRTCWHPPPPTPTTLWLPLSLSLTVCFSLSLSPLPPPSYTHRQQVFFPPKSPLQHFSNAHATVCFRGLLRDGITIKSRACRNGSAMMKRFVTIVLRGLVSLSKENPIWAKEHHRPPKKEVRRKRRAVKRAKNMGRRNLVRAVRIFSCGRPARSLEFLFSTLSLVVVSVYVKVYF